MSIRRSYETEFQLPFNYKILSPYFISMSVLFIVHIVVITGIISTVFIPLKLLRNKLFLIPLAIAVSWVVFGQCILSPISINTEADADTTKMLQYFFPMMDVRTCSNVVVAVTVALPTIMFYRLSRKCKKI